MADSLLPIGFLLIAMLYSAVGHGGATGYLALLALLAPTVPPQQASTTALTLNTVVSGLALIQFARAGHFSGQRTAPFLVSSIPLAFLGGALKVPLWLFHLLLLVGLAMAAVRLLMLDSSRSARLDESNPVRMPPVALALGVGAVIGLISGIVGIGGGIFLSPLLILMRWATPRDTAGVAASFVLMNSVAGLLARALTGTLTFGSLWLPMLSAIVGGLIGSYLGARYLIPALLNRLLAIVLTIACGKLALMLRF